MLFYDRNKYTNAPIDDDLIYKFENQYHIRILFGAAIGSTVFGIDNAESDIDFNFFFTGKVSSFRIMENNCDFILINYQEMIDGIISNTAGVVKYPSILFRESIPVINKFDCLRSDYFSSQKIIEVLYSNCIWDSGYLKENLDKLLGEINILNALDYYYSRAYGNLKNHLCKQDVECKRLLRCFVSCCCMQQLIEERTIPCVNIDYLIENFSFGQNKAYLSRALEIVHESGNGFYSEMHKFDFQIDDIFSLDENVANSSKSLMKKTNALINSNADFNKWIEKWLSDIAEKMQRIDIKEFKIDLGDNCVFGNIEYSA